MYWVALKANCAGTTTHQHRNRGIADHGWGLRVIAELID